MGRLQASWAIFKQSWAVVWGQPKLLLFPAVTSAFTLGLCFFFVAPVVLQPTGHSMTEAAHWSAVLRSVVSEKSIQDLKVAAGKNDRTRRESVQLTPKATAYLVFIYFVSMFFAAFFNTAFCYEIFRAIANHPVSIRRGLAFAASRWKPILAWSLFAGLIGFLISKLEEQFGLVGRWVVRLIGMAWSVASVFAIPVIVCSPEQIMPLETLRRSATSIRKTWGESLAGYVGMGAVSGIVTLLACVAMIGFMVLGIMVNQPLLMVAGLILGVGALIAFSYVWSVTGQVFRCALYQSVLTGLPPASFTAASLKAAWKPK